jgi:sigma-B regulation protein RsbU (phosphoserine phosphatase)
MAAAFTLGERLGMLGLISIIAAILFAIIFSNSITKPLKKLMLATAAVARGDFNVDPKVKTSDEVGLLANSFSLMSKKIQELVVGEVRKAHVEEELKVAAAVQESLIPPPEYKDDHFEIIGSYQSASECGGDWWGFFRIKNKLCVMIADATGHGVPSALITASARSCFSVLAKLAREKEYFTLNPGEMMSYTNRVVFDAAMTKIMMTFFIGVIDLETKTITYANAGHNPPWLFRKNGERYQLKSLVPKGTRVGEREESGAYEEMSAPIDVGDILFLYTDGLMENTNPEKEQYGKKRAKAVVEAALEGGPRGVIDALKASYMQYNGSEKALDDDVTLASIRIHTSPS